jgi:hypothetical protein
MSYSLSKEWFSFSTRHRRLRVYANRSDLDDEHLRKRGPAVARYAVFAERLQADVIGSGVEVRVNDLGDLFWAALRDDRIDQPI